MKASISHFLIGHLRWRVVQRSARLWCILTGSCKNTIIIISGAADTIWLHLYSKITCVCSAVYEYVATPVLTWTMTWRNRQVRYYQRKRNAKSNFNCLSVQTTLELNYNMITISTASFIECKAHSTNVYNDNWCVSHVSVLPRNSKICIHVLPLWRTCMQKITIITIIIPGCFVTLQRIFVNAQNQISPALRRLHTSLFESPSKHMRGTTKQ